jgi:hypothetical protein
VQHEGSLNAGTLAVAYMAGIAGLELQPNTVSLTNNLASLVVESAATAASMARQKARDFIGPRSAWRWRQVLVAELVDEIARGLDRGGVAHGGAVLVRGTARD